MPDETAALHGRTCLRCGHQWWPRSPQRTVRCPKCTSPYWDREPTRTNAKALKARAAKKPARRVRRKPGGPA